jgi:opacity protein-like surface antigen
MMRHLGIGMLLVAILGASLAKADVVDQVTYTINFTGTGSLPTAGSFTWDPDSATFTSFHVTWDSLDFNFTVGNNIDANHPFYFPGLDNVPCLGSATGPSASFALLTGACTPSPVGFTTQWAAVECFCVGSFTFETSAQDNSGAIQVIAEHSQVQTNDHAQGQWSVTADAAPVPEPSTLVLAPLALCVLMASRARLRAPLWHRTVTTARRLLQPLSLSHAPASSHIELGVEYRQALQP